MKTQRYFLLLVLCLVSISCSIDNRLYNARRYFRTAQNRPLGVNGRPTAQAMADYTKVIEKCGFILTERKLSREADDAFFLMARALYYKGNAAFQARDQFTSLINSLPDSPYLPEAYLYLARVTYEINRPEEAEKILEAFIHMPQYRKFHPRALLLLADFEIRQNDYFRAQYWLEKIIAEYRHTREYNEAFFLFGKNYFEQKNFERSLSEFLKFYVTRGVAKVLALDALYYIALNRYELGQYETGYHQVQTLVNQELRTDKLGQARVLKARYLIAMGKEDAGKKEFEEVTKLYPRSSAAADAFYYLAEYLYLKQGNRRDAITYYNRVRSEFATSPYAQKSMAKANALSHQNQGAGLRMDSNLQAYLDFHFLAADNFQSHFGLADSAIVYYQRVIREGDRLIGLADSLTVVLDAKRSELDSLSIVIEALDSQKTEAEKSLDPDLKGPREYDETDQEDSYQPEDADALGKEMEPETALKDETENEIMDDPAPSKQLDENIALRQRHQELNIEVTNLQRRVDQLVPIRDRLRAEHIPFAMFVKASILNRDPQRKSAVEELFQVMTEGFTDNKYTNAVRQLLNNQPIRIIDPREEEQGRRLDRAFAFAQTDADSMLTILNELAGSVYPEINLRANFRLGWHYTFEEPDSLMAVQYLNEALRRRSTGEHADLIRRFYDGSRFTITFAGAVTDAVELATDTLLVIGQEPDTGDTPIHPDSLSVPNEEYNELPKIKSDRVDDEEVEHIRFPKLFPLKPENGVSSDH